MAEVRTIALSVSPPIDFAPIENAYQDILSLFAGRFPGYLGCNTAYHDIYHTMDVLLAAVRLVHGVALTGTDFSAQEVSEMLLAALMHDTGYIQRQSESSGTGAQYTSTHVERSIDFIASYLSGGQKIPEVDLEAMAQMLRCTGLNVSIDAITFTSEKTRLLGFILGTADLLGQMSDRYYVEKLPILYEEFQEGGIPGFSSDFDLIQKTPAFHAMVAERFENTFNGINHFMKNHFLERWNIDGDLYAVSLKKNQDYLKLLGRDPDYKKRTKRKRMDWHYHGAR
jgi:hypothetical protein